MKTSSLLLVCLALLASVAAHAGPIKKVPARITKPGKYTLDAAEVRADSAAAIERGIDGAVTVPLGVTLDARAPAGKGC